MKPSDREPPITFGWKATPLPYDDFEEPEEYEEISEQMCDECGAELEELYEGMVICEVCGKHFPTRG